VEALLELEMVPMDPSSDAFLMNGMVNFVILLFLCVFVTTNEQDAGDRGQGAIEDRGRERMGYMLTGDN